VNGFNVIYQQFRSAVTVQDSSQFLCASTPKYHAADKHDTPPSHFKLTLGQPALN